MTDNFVEREAARQRSLHTAIDFWGEVTKAVHECCKSFNDHFPNLASVKVSEMPTWHGLRVEIEKTESRVIPRKRTVDLRFAEWPPRILVTKDNSSGTTYEVDADERHIYIKHEENEITIDQFLELALRNALFDPERSNG